MDDTGIETALLGAFEALNLGPTAWPNVEFTLPADGVWFRVTYIPGEATSAGIGAGARERVAGVLFVNVFAGVHTGRAGARAAAQVMAAFRRGDVIEAAGGEKIRIGHTRRLGAMLEDSWYNTPVQVPVLVDIPN